jgi:hypothetical protein
VNERPLRRPRSLSEARKERRKHAADAGRQVKGKKAQGGREADAIESGSVLMAAALLAQHFLRCRFEQRVQGAGDNSLCLVNSR